MRASTFISWTKEFRGVATAVKKAGSNKITRELLKKIASISVERIDRRLLATILEETYHNEFRDEFKEATYYMVPCLYIVWSDGRIERSDRILISEARSIYDSGELIYSGPWQEDIISQAKAKPIASYFTNRDDVKHLILLVKNGSSGYDGEDNFEEVDDIKIIVYKPQKDFDLKSVAREIMTVFAKGGEQGLSDYREFVYYDENPDALGTDPDLENSETNQD